MFVVPARLALFCPCGGSDCPYGNFVSNWSVGNQFGYVHGQARAQSVDYSQAFIHFLNIRRCEPFLFFVAERAADGANVIHREPALHDDGETDIIPLLICIAKMLFVISCVSPKMLFYELCSTASMLPKCSINGAALECIEFAKSGFQRSLLSCFLNLPN
jgi:hypothetical protein